MFIILFHKIDTGMTLNVFNSFAPYIQHNVEENDGPVK